MEIKKEVISILFLLSLVSLAYAQSAPPDIPDHFYGAIKINNNDAPIGTQIGIYINNGLESTVTTTITGQYNLYVTTGYTGDIVKFLINNAEATTYQRQGGALINLNLSITTDSDGDGTSDQIDPLLGDITNVTSNLGSLNISIGGINSTSGAFSGTKLVEFYSNNEKVITFDFDFDSKILNLSNLQITKQTSPTEGSIVVKGMPSGVSKTVYIDRLTPSDNSVCIKDAEISNISEVSSSCDGTNEFKVECPGTNGGYTCSVEGSRFKVSGLQHSGVKEFYIAPLSNSPGGGSGGGSGGGGGSGSSKGSSSSTPSTTDDQQPVEDQPTQEVQDNPQSDNTEGTPNENSNDLTGAVIGSGNKTNFKLPIIFVLVVVVLALVFNFKDKVKKFRM